MNCLTWKFGQKFVMPNGITYWSTDTGYTFADYRRDVLLLLGTEPVRTLMPNGDHALLQTALCCQTVAFVSISNLHQLYRTLGTHLPDTLKEEIVDDGLTFVLGRWLTSHPSAFRRDALCRPICTGPLENTHCLWTFSKTSRPRQAMVFPNNIIPSSSLTLFGTTREQRLTTWNAEKHAYYCLVLPSTIVTSCYVSPEFNLDTMEESDLLLETVTVV